MRIRILASTAALILGVPVLPTIVGAQDVQDYLVGKTEALAQTSTAAPTVASFGFSAAVHARNSGTLISASVTLPAGSTFPSPQALGPDGNGGLNFNEGSLTQAGLDAKFNSGTYGLSVTGGAGSYSANLTLTGNSYPAPPPTITNTNWSGGALVIDPTQNFTFAWNSFGNFIPGEDNVGLFDESGALNFYFDTNTTSQFIPAGTLAPNTTYTFHLTFNHIVNTNTSSIPGASGSASYQDNTAFTVQTAPGPPVITSPLAASGTVGLPFTYQFEAAGATSLGVSNLPSGLTYNTSLKAITGKPTIAGISQVGLSATNPQGTTNAALTITVQAAPTGLAFVSSSCATGRTGRPFSFQLQTRGGSSATRFAVDSLPNGLHLDPFTGSITGNPTSNGSFGVRVSAIDGAATASATLQLTFTSDPTVPVITSERTVTLTPGQFFTYAITADANGTFGYIGSDGIVHQAPAASCTGLPAGLCFDGDHTISGIFNPTFGSDRGSSARPDQTGGIITNVQLLAANPPNGTSIISLLPLRAARGATNIATRLAVGTGENVLIGGFIIAESVAGSGGPKKVVIRAVGPSLTQFGVPNALQDSTLEVHDGAGSLLGSNDNWRDAQGQANQIIDAHLQPRDDREAAILAYLNPGQYTAVVSGKNNSTGNALVEVYDLGTVLLADSSNSRLANIATRGTVLGGDSVMIGGVIIVSPNTRLVVRAIGPSLTPFGISGALQDPTLELRNADGMVLRSNDDWQQGQPAEIQKAGLAPTDPHESALIETLQPGNYTAIVSGKAGATGVAVVEGYALGE